MDRDRRFRGGLVASRSSMKERVVLLRGPWHNGPHQTGFDRVLWVVLLQRLGVPRTAILLPRMRGRNKFVHGFAPIRPRGRAATRYTDKRCIAPAPAVGLRSAPLGSGRSHSARAPLGGARRVPASVPAATGPGGYGRSPTAPYGPGSVRSPLAGSSYGTEGQRFESSRAR